MPRRGRWTSHRLMVLMVLSASWLAVESGPATAAPDVSQQAGVPQAVVAIGSIGSDATERVTPGSPEAGTEDPGAPADLRGAAISLPVTEPVAILAGGVGLVVIGVVLVAAAKRRLRTISGAGRGTLADHQFAAEKARMLSSTTVW